MTARIYYEAIEGNVQTTARDEITVKDQLVVAYDNPDVGGVDRKVAIPLHRVEQIMYGVDDE